MPDSSTTFQQIKNKIKKFVKDRDWEQFHSPKNLSMSLAIEVAELMESFQWLTDKQSQDLKLDKKKKSELEREIADIAIYLLNFCDVMKIDLTKAIDKKLIENSEKYPAKIVKGKAHKYNYYKNKK